MEATRAERLELEQPVRDDEFPFDENRTALL